MGLNHQDCAVLANINKQMPDITGGIHIVSMSLRFSTLTQVTQNHDRVREGRHRGVAPLTHSADSIQDDLFSNPA